MSFNTDSLKRIFELESERDRLSIQLRISNECIKDREKEIDRLKLELGNKKPILAWDSNCPLMKERDLRKSKAEKLVEVIENLAYYDEASVIRAKAALAEFEEGK